MGLCAPHKWPCGLMNKTLVFGVSTLSPCRRLLLKLVLTSAVFWKGGLAPETICQCLCTNCKGGPLQHRESVPTLSISVPPPRRWSGASTGEEAVQIPTGRWPPLTLGSALTVSHHQPIMKAFRQLGNQSTNQSINKAIARSTKTSPFQ